MQRFRNWLRLPSVILGAILAALLGVFTAVWAVDSLNLFELDANAVQDTLVDDWENLYDQCPDGETGTCPPGNSTVFTGIIDDGEPDVSIFWKGGSKDVEDIDQWAYKTGSVPDKDQITNAYAAAYLNPVATGIHEVNDLIITFGLDRFANNGDAFAGFWFFQNNVSLVSPGSTFNGVHVAKTNSSPGDLLVLVEYPQGANAEPVIKVYEWDPNDVDGDGNAAPNLDLAFDSTGSGQSAMCGDSITGMKEACAITNSDTEIAPWPYMAKSGGSDFPFESFYEGAINVTELLGTTPCFSSFLAETRSSRSETAQLKDFVLAAFPLCRAVVTTEIHDSNDPNHATDPTDIQNTTVKVGTVIHDLAIVSGEGIPNLPDPTGSVTFTLYDNLTCDGNVVAGWPEDKNLTGQGGGVATAESSDFDTLGKPGEYSFSATYNGDDNYPSSTLKDCEPITVEKFDSKTETEIHQGNMHVDIQAGVGLGSVDVGTLIHDFAKVTELNDTSGAPVPTGNVTFHFFSDGVCGSEVIGDVSGTTYPFTTPLNGSGEAETPDLVTQAGALSFKAMYGGDANYNASSESGCETLTVNKLDAAIRTEIHNPAHDDITGQTVKVGLTIHDEAFVTGDGPTPTGTVTFTLYANLTCSGSVVSSETVALNGGVAVSSSQTPAAGMLSYSASYSGDAIYNPAGPALCEPLTVEKFASKTVTEIHKKGMHVDIQGSAVDVGTEIHDFAKVTEIAGDSGAPVPTGNVTFHFFSDGNCQSEVTGNVSGTLYPFTTPLNGSGEAETPDLVTQAGALSFKAMYGGDANYLPSAESGCETLTVNKLDAAIRTEVHDPNHSDITGQTILTGIMVHDKAFVTGAGPTPTGIATFTLYDNLTCDGNVVSTEPVALANGMAETTPFLPGAGMWSFSASYGGDDIYNPAGPAVCEPFTVEPPGEEGCTPGFWKNSTGSWEVYKPSDKVVAVFNVPNNYLNGKDKISVNDTLHDALGYDGGETIRGAAKILLRAAVAALLNAAHSGVDYPRTESEVIMAVNAALASSDRNTILTLAGQLDADNNLGCPLPNDNSFLK